MNSLEMIDVLDARPPDGCERVIDDGAFVKGQHGFLHVARVRPQTTSMATCDEDGLEFHGSWSC